MRLVPRLAVSPADVEKLRVLRNETRKWMTGSTASITLGQQLAWWPGHVGTAWLYTAPGGGTVGYTYVRPAPDDEQRLYVTVGLTAGARGRGFGPELYRHVAMATPCRVRALIRDDNTPSIKSVERAGWELIGTAHIGELPVVEYLSPLLWRDRIGSE